MAAIPEIQIQANSKHFLLACRTNHIRSSVPFSNFEEAGRDDQKNIIKFDFVR